MASNFAIVTSSQEHGVQAQYDTPVSMTYLTLHVPPAETCPKVKMIQFECESESRDKSSPDNSYSWGDLVVKSNSGEEIYRQNRAYVNTSSDYQIQVKLYNENDEIVKKCAPGSTLQLVLCAQYQGWTNFAKSGRITIFY